MRLFYIMRRRRRIRHARRPKRSSHEYLANKHAALTLATAKVVHFTARYGFEYTKITIRNQRTRWGSCTEKGSLSFNYRILFLSPEVQDYLVVHEVCHLDELNHSQKFWDLVAREIPGYRELRRRLKGIRIK